VLRVTLRQNRQHKRQNWKSEI